MNIDHLTEAHQQFYRSILPEREAEESLQRILEANAGWTPPVYKLGGGTKHDPQVALGDHLSAQATPPDSCHRGLWSGYRDILGNDRTGNCGPCMVIHGIEGMHHAARTDPPPFQVQDAMQFYSEEAGYVPGHPDTDNGTDNSVMMRKYQYPGVYCSAERQRHSVAGTVFVDITNSVEMRVAIVEFAVVYRAFALPISAQGQKQWEVVGDGQSGDSAPGGWGGHDVVGHAYGPDYVDDDSWGIWLPASTDFDKRYGIQAIVPISYEMLTRTGTSPTGLNWTSLNGELHKFAPVTA